MNGLRVNLKCFGRNREVITVKKADYATHVTSVKVAPARNQRGKIKKNILNNSIT